jgi:hypothetical protein
MIRRHVWVYAFLVVPIFSYGQVSSEEAYRRLQEREQQRKLRTAQVATQPATLPTSRPISLNAQRGSVNDVFIKIEAGLPRDAGIDPKSGWDEFVVPKARAWFEKSVHGKPLESAIEVESAQLIRISAPDNQNKTLHWEIRVSARPQIFTSGGVKQVGVLVGGLEPPVVGADGQYLNPGGPLGLCVTCDEAMARRLRSIKAGDLLTLKGTVDQVLLSERPFARADLTLLRAMDDWAHSDAKNARPKGCITIVLTSCEVADFQPKNLRKP